MSSLFQTMMKRFIAISARTKEQFKSKDGGIFSNNIKFASVMFLNTQPQSEENMAYLQIVKNS